MWRRCYDKDPVEAARDASFETLVAVPATACSVLGPSSMIKTIVACACLTALLTGCPDSYYVHGRGVERRHERRGEADRDRHSEERHEDHEGQQHEGRP